MTKILALALALLPALVAAQPRGPLATYLLEEPCRFLDTREQPPGLDSGPVGPIGRAYQIRGACAVPLEAAGLILNVTVVGATAPGHLSIWPADYQVRPKTSGINFQPGLTLANEMTVRLAKLAGPGYADVWLDAETLGQVDVVIDVVGFLR